MIKDDEVTNPAPGPWSKGSYRYQISMELPVIEIVDNKNYVVGTAFGHPNMPSNANLMAAAPELLEDLQEAIVEMSCGCGHPACRNCQRVERWKKTVNKALG